MVKIVETKPVLQVFNTRLPVDIFEDIDRVQLTCSKVQNLTKTELIRAALRVGLAKIEADALKAMDTKKARSTDEG